MDVDQSTLRGGTSTDGKPVREFVGRRWVLERIDGWLNGSKRYFHLMGEPGSGKSALSRELVFLSGASTGDESAFPMLQPGFLSAVHFCSTRDRRSVNPLAFAESIGSQLAARNPVYMQAMLKAAGTPINVEQHVGLAQDKVIGVIIHELNARGASAEDAFETLVRAPLEALCAAQKATQVVILVDALDEALVYRGDVGIVPLLAQAHTLPPCVRFLLTSRLVPEIDRRLAPLALDVERIIVSATEWNKKNEEDITEYVAKRFREDLRIGPEVAASGQSIIRVAAVINERSGGNFQYARFLLDAVANGQWKISELTSTGPGASSSGARGLDALYLLYMESLQRVVDIGKRDWSDQYAPIMEVLSAAQETLPRDKIRAFAAQKEADFRNNLDDLRQFFEQETPSAGVESGLRLYHQSFTEFLRTPTLHPDAGELENPFHLTAYDSHARIADSIAGAYAADWSSCLDHYALRYAAAHYAGAACIDTQPSRHERTSALVSLVTDEDFQGAHRDQLDDPLALRGDMERALAVAAADDHMHAPPLVVRTALALQAEQRENARPDVLFDLARAGDVNGAERRLALFRIDSDWRQAVLLTIAWLAAPSNAAAAQALRDRIVQDGISPPLQLLVARLDADALHGVPVSLPTLPPAPDEWVVKSIFDRLSGNSVTGIEPLDLERIHADGYGDASSETAPSYLAEQDGPLLVSFAVNAGNETGDRYLSRYIAAQAANGYEFYRNRSLWALVSPVLGHPDAAWVRKTLIALSMGALASTAVQFGKALPFTVLALRARAGDVAATGDYSVRRENARIRAAGISPAREGDPWSHYLRLMIALAEIEGRCFARTNEATEFTDRAMRLPFGFAGFNAAARLTLTELLRIEQPANVAGIGSAFEMARGSAHNVQDYVFCARATSRVEAMRLYWLTAVSTESLPDFVASLVRDAFEGRFGARHTIGEQFDMRVDTNHRLPIPHWARQANSLEYLARLYQRPVADFMRMNAERGWQPDEAIPHGTTVQIPDGDFPPMIAARLAAEALAQNSLSASRRTRLIQALVPVAAREYTALDLVLSRLLLAALPTASASLAHLSESVARYVPQTMLGEAPPVGQTGYPA